MRHLLLIIMLIPVVTNASDWTAGTANTSPKRTWEVGIFNPLKVAITDNTEIATFPIDNLLYPNLGIKHRWKKNIHWAFASQHNLSYPSLLLKTISREGSGGILPANSDIPQLLTLNNRFLVSYETSTGLIITPQFGFEVTYGAQQDRFPTIDLPLIYQRTASYHSGYTVNAGIDIDGDINTHWAYSLDLDLYYLPDMDGNTSLEHKALLQYFTGQYLTLMAGYKYVRGEYPFGKNIRLIPLVDLLWRW